MHKPGHLVDKLGVLMSVKIGERTKLLHENDLELLGAFKGSLCQGI